MDMKDDKKRLNDILQNKIAVRESKMKADAGINVGNLKKEIMGLPISDRAEAAVKTFVAATKTMSEARKALEKEGYGIYVNTDSFKAELSPCDSHPVMKAELEICEKANRWGDDMSEKVDKKLALAGSHAEMSEVVNDLEKDIVFGTVELGEAPREVLERMRKAAEGKK